MPHKFNLVDLDLVLGVRVQHLLDVLSQPVGDADSPVARNALGRCSSDSNASDSLRDTLILQLLSLLPSFHIRRETIFSPWRKVQQECVQGVDLQLFHLLSGSLADAILHSTCNLCQDVQLIFESAASDRFA